MTKNNAETVEKIEKKSGKRKMSPRKVPTFW